MNPTLIVVKPLRRPETEQSVGTLPTGTVFRWGEGVYIKTDAIECTACNIATGALCVASPRLQVTLAKAVLEWEAL